MIRKARNEDVPGIRQFLANREEHGIIPRPLAYIYGHLRDYHIFSGNLSQPKIVGMAALHICWDGVAEIRSLAVRARCRGKGIGRKLVEECLAEALCLGINEVFLLTLVPQYFSQFGFEIVKRDEIPVVAWADCVHCTRFPECNEIPMIKNLYPF